MAGLRRRRRGGSAKARVAAGGGVGGGAGGGGGGEAGWWRRHLKGARGGVAGARGRPGRSPARTLLGVHAAHGGAREGRRRRGVGPAWPGWASAQSGAGVFLYKIIPPNRK